MDNNIDYYEHSENDEEDLLVEVIEIPKFSKPDDLLKRWIEIDSEKYKNGQKNEYLYPVNFIYYQRCV